MSAPPRPVARLSDQVAAQLQALILDGAFGHGDRLPSERELGELLAVSRTAVREGVRSLVAKGLLEVRQGEGTVVRAPDVKFASELMTIMLRLTGGAVFDRVHEVRALLEVEIAGLAAARRTPDDLAILSARLEESAQSGADHERWAVADIALHATLASATHNPLYLVLLDAMAEMLTELRLTAAELPDTPLRAQRHHVAIVDAVRAGDQRAARRAMTDHMAEAEATYQRARLVRGLTNASRPGREGSVT